MFCVSKTNRYSSQAQYHNVRYIKSLYLLSKYLYIELSFEPIFIPNFLKVKASKPISSIKSILPEIIRFPKSEDCGSLLYMPLGTSIVKFESNIFILKYFTRKYNSFTINIRKLTQLSLSLPVIQITIISMMF